MSTSCIICACSNASYKCPTCRARYCCAKCCKLHKQNREQCVPHSEPEVDILSSPVSVDINKECNYEKILSGEQKKRLSSNVLLTNLLKSQKLQYKITAIDGSDNRLRELKRARGNKEFEDVVCLILDVIKE